MKISSKYKNNFLEISILGIFLIGIIITRLYSYLLFHSIVELFSIIIASVIFVIVWSMRKEIDNSFFLLLGISSLFIAIIDFIHTLAYPGMGIIQGANTNLAAQFWIAARFMQSLSLLFGIFLINKKFKAGVLLATYTIITCILIIIIFMCLFPICFIEGSGLTFFKIVSEYIIILIFLFTIILFLRFKANFNKNTYYLIIAFLVTSILSEFSFTLYLSAYEFPNLLGHILKIIAFYFLYKALIQIGLKNPIELLFIKLNLSKNKFEEAYKQANFFKDLIAHDLNNVLQVILFGIDNCKKLIRTPEKLEEISKVIEYIEIQVMNGAHLISNATLLSKIEKVEMMIKPIEIKSILNKIINNTKNLFQNRNISIQIESTDEYLYVQANELIADLFENLIVNAIKHNNEILLEILVKISKEQLKKINFLKIEFIDNGKGMDDNIKEKVFQKGFRLDSNTHGMGLGLTLVKKIIEIFKGKIWIEDRVKGDYSKGCNFVLLIPEALM